jgi:hypothetical protein
VAVTLAAPSLTIGQTTQATAVAKDASGNTLTGRTVAWSSLAPAIATVSSTGLVTAVTAGQATIRATVESKTGDAAVGVTATVATVANVIVILNSSSLSVGQSTQASAIARDASGNILTGKSVTWTSMNPSIAAITASGLVTALAAGSATVRATVDGKTGDGSVSVALQNTPSSGPVTPPELPRAYVSTTYPSVTGASRNVPAGGDLQAALNAALPGDEIVLAAGATYAGNFVLPAKTCSSYIVIRTAGPESDFPSFGSRMTPAFAPKLAKIVTPNVGTAISAKNGSCKWWISRVEVSGIPQGGGVNYNYGLIRFGEDETSLSALPTDLVLDRVYVHGTSSLSVQHAVVFNSIRNAIIDSWVSDIHWPGTETHAVAGYAGPGPFKIVNNYLEAASINILFGGAPATIAGVHPSDFEIRRNHLYKPLSYIGQGYAVKNLLELKHALRVLVEDNILENSWADAQTGYAVNLLSGGDSGRGFAQVADVTFRYNIIRNAPVGITVAANPEQQAVPVARVAIEHNLFENIGPVAPNDNEARGIQLLDNLTNIRVAHNTLFRMSGAGGASFLVSRDAGVPQASNVVIVDNLVGGSRPYGAVIGSGTIGLDAINDWAGTSWQFDHNVLWDSNVAPPDSRATAGNFWPANQADVAFASDWSLSASSPFKAKASDGTDPGVNIAALRQRTANVP